MSTVLDVATRVLLFLILVWVVFFGVPGALIAHQRGGSPIAGFFWGVALGPIGWIVTFFLTRGGSRRDDDSDDSRDSPRDNDRAAKELQQLLDDD